MSQPTGYSRTQISLHWATVILVLLQYLFAGGMGYTFHKGMETGALTLSAPAALHMGTGTLILALVIWRLLIRNDRGAPPAPEGEPAWAAAISVWAHRGFYVLLIAAPITGALAWGTASGAMAGIHGLCRALLLLLILGHIAAVAMHQLVWKTGVLERMRTPEEG